MNNYKEVTDDRGLVQIYGARDNMAKYIMTSARAHDMRDEYIKKYNRQPSAKWYNKHFTFTKLNK